MNRYITNSIANPCRKIEVLVVVVNIKIFITTLEGIKRRRNRFLIEAVVVITQEAAIKIDAAGEGREAERELGARSSIAKKAVGLGEILVALG